MAISILHCNIIHYENRLLDNTQLVLKFDSLYHLQLDLMQLSISYITLSNNFADFTGKTGVNVYLL